MSILGKYRNGNYDVTILSDGTKIRENDLDYFEASFPESMDIKITNSCDMGCPMCHEDSKPNGRHGNILNIPFLDSLHSYTELAIGGGNPLSHPDLVPFLHMLKDRKLIPNMTVNQVHFMKNVPLLLELSRQGLLYGLGISYVSSSKENAEKFINEVVKFPNAVIHVINGMIDIEHLKWMSGRGLKILILGYKDFRRGVEYRANNEGSVSRKKNELFEVLPEIVKDGWFNTVSFDNLAISQLEPRRLMNDEEWGQFFMGDDGRDGELTSASMYVDMVEEVYARNSCSNERFDLLENIDEMFSHLKELGKKNA